MRLSIATPHKSVPRERARLLGSIDLRNVGLLVVGFVCLILLVPPLRTFPITDDWTYARSVPHLLNLTYVPDEASQASALAHIAWGALFAGLFGQSFTVLSVANLVMGLAGVITFYLLLRQVGVTPVYSLLGAAMLGLNPIYVYLCYTFMTDVTFLVFLLLGCLCFVRGMQGHGEKWLWLGGVAAALAYLTRQYGIILVPAALLYLWWSRDWAWRKAMAIAVIPIIAAIIYMLFEAAQPKTLAAILSSNVTSNILQHPIEYAVGRLQQDAWILYVLGLFLLPFISLPRRPLIAAPIFGAMVLFIFLTISQYGSAFPETGNVVDHSGFVMFEYNVKPLWSEGIWSTLAVIGAISVSLHVSALGESAWVWLRSSGLRSRTRNPLLVLSLLGIMLSAVVFVLTPFVFDRYALPLLTLLLVPVLLNYSAEYKKKRIVWYALLMLPMAIFSIVGQHDYMEHATTRWQAAETLASQGVARDKIDAGFEWINWYLFDEGLNYMRQTGDYRNAGSAAKAMLDPLYVVSDLPVSQYDQISALPYTSWLSGGETRYVRVFKRK